MDGPYFNQYGESSMQNGNKDGEPLPLEVEEVLPENIIRYIEISMLEGVTFVNAAIEVLGSAYYEIAEAVDYSKEGILDAIAKELGVPKAAEAEWWKKWNSDKNFRAANLPNADPSAVLAGEVPPEGDINHPLH